jgi:aspartyl-tRNA(Asn)/glutamyl-tRNA(Gln) amidotransferase subunit C
MALTREQVRHVAELAKLKLTEAEVALFQEQLSAILDYAERLDELDTEQIPPTAAVLPLTNVMRADAPRASFPRDTMLSNAPAAQEGFVKVKVVLEID